MFKSMNQIKKNRRKLRKEGCTAKGKNFYPKPTRQGAGIGSDKSSRNRRKKERSTANQSMCTRDKRNGGASSVKGLTNIGYSKGPLP